MRYDYGGDGDAGKDAVAAGERTYRWPRTDGDVWLKLSDLTEDVRRLHERMLAIEAKLDAGYYAPKLDDLAPELADVPDVLAKLYKDTDQLARRENALPAEFVNPEPMGLLRKPGR